MKKLSKFFVTPTNSNQLQSNISRKNNRATFGLFLNLYSSMWNFDLREEVRYKLFKKFFQEITYRELITPTLKSTTWKSDVEEEQPASWFAG